MTTQTQGFLSSLGNIFKTKEEALNENRKAILAKYLIHERTDYEYGNSWFNRDNVTKTIKTVPDNHSINNFLEYYNDVMSKLKEIDNVKL